MRHVVVTGAGGFIGRRLVERLLRDGGVGDGAAPIERLTVVDLHLPDGPADPRLRRVRGSLTSPDVRRALLEGGVDGLFHLAAVPGGLAESDPALGLELNLLATTALAQELAREAAERSAPVRLVYTSTIAVLGGTLPPLVDDDTLPRPSLSYGAHKLMIETLLTDMARRGQVDARCIRLPGILARPRAPSGLVSAFMSDLFHALEAGEEITLPVSAGGTVWAMSVPCVVECLLHAARLSPETLPPGRRAWTLPAVRTGMAALVEAAAAAAGRSAGLVRFEALPAVEALFASYPPLETPLAEGLGFRADGDVAALVAAARDALRYGRAA